jgi:alkylhydroperoxidase family enzyme
MRTDLVNTRMAPAHTPLATVVAALAGHATGSEPLRVFTTIARHPRLFRRWLLFADGLLLRGSLPRADTELLVLRAAWNCAGWYVWVQHAGLAPAHGLPRELVEAIPDGPDSPVWTDRQRALLFAADELDRNRVLTDATWTELAGQLSDRELIELCFVVGHYEMLASTLNSLGVQPEPAALHAISGRAAEHAESLRTRLAQSST